MKISVVIPTFNRSRYVGLAIESVLRQTVPCSEIIVVDDGSTDDTRDTVGNFGVKVKYVYQENDGVSSARNTGIGKSTGDWIAFLDSDDEWSGNYLAVQTENLSACPGAVAALTNANTRHADGNITSLYAETSFQKLFIGGDRLVLDFPLRWIAAYTPWFLQAFIVRRSTLLTTGLLDEMLSIGEDLDLIFRVARSGPFVFDRREFVTVFRRQEDMSSLSLRSLEDEIGRQRSFILVYERALASSGLGPLENLALRRVLIRHRRALGNALMRDNRVAEARAEYLSAIVDCPSAASLVRYFQSFVGGKLR